MGMYFFRSLLILSFSSMFLSLRWQLTRVTLWDTWSFFQHELEFLQASSGIFSRSGRGRPFHAALVARSRWNQAGHSLFYLPLEDSESDRETCQFDLEVEALFSEMPIESFCSNWIAAWAVCDPVFGDCSFLHVS